MSDEKWAISAKSLEFDEGFSLGVALCPVFCFLAGLSIELLLKAICKGLEQPVGNHHRLVDLGALAECFWKVRDCTFESVEWGMD